MNQPTEKKALRSKDTESFIAPPPLKGGRVIGIDCHPDTFTIVVYKGSNHHDAEKLLTKADMTLKELLQWAGEYCTDRDFLFMEAGGNSFEIHWKLTKLGLRSFVLESAFVGRHAKTYADNDKMAAARIALVYLGTKAPCVWVPDEDTRQRRELLHIYSKSVTQHTQATNMLKGYLNQYTIRLGKRSLLKDSTKKWVLKQKEWTDLQKFMLEDYFKQILDSAKRRKNSLRLMAVEINKNPQMLSLLSLLGISLINAYALVAVIGDIKRFSNHKKLAAYLGLNPGRKQSGTSIDIQKGIGKRGRKDMRALLIQAAHAVLRQGRKTSIGAWGMKLYLRKGHRNIAVGGVARKLSTQIWYLLSGKSPTMLEPSKSRDTKFRKLMTAIGKDTRLVLGLPKTIAASVAFYNQRLDELLSQLQATTGNERPKLTTRTYKLS